MGNTFPFRSGFRVFPLVLRALSCTFDGRTLPVGFAGFISKEGSESVIDVEVNGKVTPICKENTWNEDEESLSCSHGEADRG